MSAKKSTAKKTTTKSAAKNSDKPAKISALDAAAKVLGESPRTDGNQGDD